MICPVWGIVFQPNQWEGRCLVRYPLDLSRRFLSRLARVSCSRSSRTRGCFLGGRIFVLNPATGVSSLWLSDSALQVDPTGQPEFGVVANVFSLDGKTLYLANFSSDFIYSVPVTTMSVAALSSA